MSAVVFPEPVSCLITPECARDLSPSYIQFPLTAAIVVSSGKRHPGDFTLWKCQPAGEVGWDFEWEGVGTVRGRPGWHIECSTLAK